MNNAAHFMKLAVALAQTNPMHPFGTVIVDRRDARIVGQGVNRVEDNPLWHGEICAINDCVDRGEQIVWNDLDLYTTAEPCPMCQAAIIWAGIGRVFFGTSISRLAELGWRQIQISASTIVQHASEISCEVFGGVLMDECDALFQRAQKQ